MGGGGREPLRVASREWDHPICCTFNIEKDPMLPSIQQLADVRLIYILFASLDHNKFSFFFLLDVMLLVVSSSTV